MTVNRTQSTMLDMYMDTSTVYGSHMLFTTNSSGMQEMEPLKLHIFVDNSLVEIFANDRFALATRIYPARDDSTGISFYVGEGSGNVTFQNVTMWTHLKNAWPDRPANSSIELDYDTVAETGNYTYWVGW